MQALGHEFRLPPSRLQQATGALHRLERTVERVLGVDNFMVKTRRAAGTKAAAFQYKDTVLKVGKENLFRV